MKKLFTIIFVATSITSLISECQNNLNESTKTIIDNALALQKKLDAIPADIKAINNHLSIEQIIKLLLIHNALKDSNITEKLDLRKKSYQQLQIAVNWFENNTDVHRWIEYLAIHNQMLQAIEQELAQLKSVPQLHDFCKQTAEKILAALYNGIILLKIDTKSSQDDINSLIHAYQDYAQLFKNYVQIDWQTISLF